MTALSGVVSVEWRDLVMLSYEIDPLWLVPHVPAGMSLDFWQGRALLTVTGSRMADMRVGDVVLAPHQQLEKVSFRFYVWRRAGTELRRGVVSLKEIVPPGTVGRNVRLALDDRCLTAPMRHEVVENGRAAYEWQERGTWNRVAASRDGCAQPSAPGSIDAFVTDRPWAYAGQPGGATLEYFVDHPAWDVWQAVEPRLECDIASVLGRSFAGAFARPPASAVVAAGSVATLHPGRLIE